MVFGFLRPCFVILVETILVNIFNPSNLKLFLGNLSMLITFIHLCDRGPDVVTSFPDGSWRGDSRHQRHA